MPWPATGSPVNDRMVATRSSPAPSLALSHPAHTPPRAQNDSVTAQRDTSTSRAIMPQALLGRPGPTRAPLRGGALGRGASVRVVDHCRHRALLLRKILLVLELHRPAPADGDGVVLLEHLRAEDHHPAASLGGGLAA